MKGFLRNTGNLLIVLLWLAALASIVAWGMEYLFWHVFGLDVLMLSLFAGAAASAMFGAGSCFGHWVRRKQEEAHGFY